MHHLPRAIWNYFLDANQESRYKNIDSENVVARDQETQMSDETSSTSSSFYLVSEGIVTNTSMPSKNESTPEPEMVLLSRRLDSLKLGGSQRSGATYPDNVRKNLERELERLRTRQAKMVRRNNARMQELETLKRQDEEEQWEDDLFQTRMKELEAANAIIETRSPISKEDIIIRVKEINELIIHISSALVAGRPRRQRTSSLHDTVKSVLGEHFLPFLQRFGYYYEERTIKALLQIYLARSCTGVITFWNHEKYLNNCLDQLYNLIAVNESQVIAGKWRQMAFKQLAHGPDQEALEKFTMDIVHTTLTIASCAGWGGSDTSEIEALVEELVGKAGIVREYAKAGLLSADIQAWIAFAGDVYDPATMQGASSGSEMGSRILGSTGVGLSVRHASRDGVTLQTLLPSKVFCIRG